MMIIVRIQIVMNVMNPLELLSALEIMIRIFNSTQQQLTLKLSIKTLTNGAVAATMMHTITERTNQFTTAKPVNGKTSFLKVMPRVIHNMDMTVITATTTLKIKPTLVKKTTLTKWPSSNFW